MGYKAMDDLKEMICRELEEIAEKGQLSAGDVDTVFKLVVSKEKILRAEEIEEGMGYSNAGNWNASGTYGRGGYSKSDGMGMDADSYGRHYVRGHYSRSRGGRYSMAEGRGMMADQIRDMMEDETLTASDKAVLKRAWEQLQK